jgi:hypothetical protein
MSADVVLALTGGRLRVSYAERCAAPADARERLAAILPDLLRAVAPALPPRSEWPAEWAEIYDERLAICLADDIDPQVAVATADADLRLAVWRRDV